MEHLDCEVLVLGGGPGGYSCAARAARLGLDTLLVDAGQPGGTCLHAGCIPSKALIHAAALWHAAAPDGAAAEMGLELRRGHLDWQATQAWKDGVVAGLSAGVEGLLRGAGVRVLTGHGVMQDGKRARITSATGDEWEVRAEQVVLATGSEEILLPALPPGGPILYAEQALALDTIPEQLVVVGGGYIGLELGQAFARLGSAVAVVEQCDRILPQYDADIARVVARALTREGIALHLSSRAEGLTASGELRIETPDGVRELPADRVLVAVGRRARLTGWGLENLPLDAADGSVAVDAPLCHAHGQRLCHR